MITRRTLLAAAASATVAACAGVTAAQVVADIEDFAGALIKDLPQIEGGHGLSAGLVTDIENALPILKQIDSTVATSGASGSVSSLFQELLPIIQPLLAGAILVVGATTPFGLALAAASILLPAILSALGISMPAMARLHPTMTLDQARQILAQHARP